jgi:MFS transporter, CP family, cyanate transporter
MMRRVGLLYLCGLLAAAQLGKLSALAPLIQAELLLPLTVVAAAISMIELGGSTLGSVAGMIAWRVGLPRTLRLGVTALALGGLGGAWAHGATGLIAWRLLEALGYLSVIVTAPVLIAQHTAAAGERTQGLALTLWSTFVPVGLALGAGGAAALASAFGWRGATLALAAIGLLLCVVVWSARLPAPASHAEHRAGARLSRATWCLALGFGAFALFEIGVLGLLPTLLVREAGLSTAEAGHWTAAASVSAVAGSAAAAWLLRHGLPMRGPVMLSIGMPPLLLFGVFMPKPPLASALSLVLLLNVLGGVFASLAFALLPRLARSPGELVKANGLLAQCGASGSLLGPPAMASCVQSGGWTAAALFGLGVSVVALPLVWRALAASAQSSVAHRVHGVADQVP